VFFFFNIKLLLLNGLYKGVLEVEKGNEGFINTSFGHRENIPNPLILVFIYRIRKGNGNSFIGDFAMTLIKCPSEEEPIQSSQ